MNIEDCRTNNVPSNFLQKSVDCIFFPHRKNLFFLIALVSIILISCEKKNTTPEFVNSMTLVWSDEFDGESDEPNSENWDYNTGAHGWGNSELQNYTKDRENSFVKNGALTIKAKKIDGKWTSARLLSRLKKSFTYGYIEFRAKVPEEKGCWPALWMLPNKSEYGQWPRSGEIDVMEYSANVWGEKIYGTLHCRAGYGGNPIHSEFTVLKSVSKKWHTYAVHWTEDAITWYYDGVPFTSYENPHEEGKDAFWKWPFDKDFYVIMNVAMGGNLGGDIPKDLQECQMQVDYVRWYQ